MFDILLTLAMVAAVSAAIAAGIRLVAGTAATRGALLARVALSLAVALPVSGYLLYALMNSRSVQLAGDLVTRIETDEKVVALTFDDGPTARTAEVLGVLEREDVTATFFVTGSESAQRPDDLAAIIAAGHQVGNHTWSHPRLVFMSGTTIAREFERTDAAIRAAGYRGDILVRTPFGKRLLDAPLYFARTGRTNVFWDSEADSTKGVASDADAIVDTTLADVHPGSIMLMHVLNDSREPSREALPRIISELHARGYRFVTLDELLAERAD